MVIFNLLVDIILTGVKKVMMGKGVDFCDFACFNFLNLKKGVIYA